MWASGDDNTYVWMNGVFVGFFPYCGGSCVPVPIPVPPAALTGPGLTLAIQTDNTNPTGVFSSWALDVNCSGGGRSVVTSGNPAAPGLSLHWDLSGGGTCVGPNPPPPDGAAMTWTGVGYVPPPGYFTSPAASVTGAVFASTIYHPMTGAPLNPISFDPSGMVSNNCGILYWRQVITLPTPPPTATFTPTSTSTFTPTFTSPPTASFTSTWTGTPTNTATSTNTFTSTNTPTVTFTPTWTGTSTNTPTFTNTRTSTNTSTVTFTPTFTRTPTNTYTLTSTPTPCGWPGNTCTPTPTPIHEDNFYMSKNLLQGGQSVSIYVGYSNYGGDYSLKIYNSAGEHVRTLDSRYLYAPIQASYSWDGKNKNGEDCASGVYIFLLQEPLSRKVKRILLVR
jgi:hypothetical protein